MTVFWHAGQPGTINKPSSDQNQQDIVAANSLIELSTKEKMKNVIILHDSSTTDELIKGVMLHKLKKYITLICILTNLMLDVLL